MKCLNKNMMELLFYTLVAYAVNASCTLASLLKTHPIDFGLKFKKKRLLGDGKTIEGFLIGLSAGLISTMVLGLDFRVGFIVALASLAGDLIGSFIKRRLGLKRGEEVPLMDQLGFIITTYIALSFLIKMNYLLALLLMVVTYVAHRLTNVIAYLLKLKKVPW
jgi:CDP-2,3-bis-(O-geranylgeranyl)-sn-glycerol synthase